MKLIISFIFLCIFFSSVYTLAYGDETPTQSEGYSLIKEDKLPVVRDANYDVEVFVSGLEWPTTMTFVGDDILVLEKNSGNVRLIKDGELVKEPVINFNVDFLAEKGMLGITSSGSVVYLYLTEVDPTTKTTIGNHIYKTEWDGSVMKNPILIKNLPFGERGVHNAGVFTNGLDGKIYAIIGDVDRQGILQNYDADEFEYTSVIFDVNSDESYYAIGIRNSFGIAVDPITGEIWDTENNDKSFDEINLVEYKFNSGWDPITGPGDPQKIQTLPQYKDYKYSDPEFSWELTVSPTAISFIPKSSPMDYHNSLFVGDFTNGFIYEFKLNSDRSGFVFESPQLKDLVADGGDSIDEIVFGTGFGGITDIEFGPDGMMYVVSIMDGKIYRLNPSQTSVVSEAESTCDSKPKPRINWSGCDLSKRDFSGTDLSFADLSFAKLDNTILTKTRLTSANLSGANLENSDLIDTNLVNADMRNSKISNSNFQNSQLRYANLSNSSITESNFDNAIIRGANLKDTTIKNSDFIGTKLFYSDFEGSKIIDSDLTESDLRYSKFEHGNFDGNILNGADISHSKMASMDIVNTDIKKAIMTYVDFSNTKITSSNFEGTTPYSSDFTNTEIMKGTKTDSCIKQDLMSRIFNKILRELRDYDLDILKPLEYIFIQLCQP
jgi:uncharacterized protein YjbI with pentapeptide repeats/glucose/arabinose dehydrogenase